MSSRTTFYLSRVIGNKIFQSNETTSIGKLLDLIVDLDSVRPKVIAAKIKDQQRQIRLIDFSKFTISKKGEQYLVQCESLLDTDMGKENTLMLVKHVLDKQIVDMDGRKVVRVNDLRLAVLSGNTYTVAVDVGFEGFLRRLGVAKPLKQILKPIGVNIPSNLLLWDEIEAVDFTNRGLKLSKAYTKLQTMHPSDLADVMEDLDRSTQIAIFSSLDEHTAADVLEELESDVQVQVLESLSAEKAATMLEKMPIDEVADILEEMEEDKASEILLQMAEETSKEVKELMDYPENSVGSMMATDFISFNEHLSVEQAIRELRRLKPDSEEVYCLYIVENNGKLRATVSLRDLIVAEPAQNLNQIMNPDVIYVYDREQVEGVVDKILKYHLLAVPVVDENMVLVGIVLINDILHDMQEQKKRNRR